MGESGARPAAAPALAGAAVLAVAAAVLGALLLDRRLVRAGRADLSINSDGAAVFVLSIAGATAVGAVLAVRRSRHPVGWLFLGLGLSVAGTGLVDGYSLYGAVVRPGSLPAADLAAVLGEAAFIWWFALVSLVLQLTPTGRPLSARWRMVLLAGLAAAVVWFAAVLLWPGPLDPPRELVRSPFALPSSYTVVLRPVRVVAAVLTGAALVASAGSLLIRFRRSRGLERKRLLWLAIVAIPLPAFVLTAFLASPEHPLVVALATGGFISLVPVAAGLSVARYHLYDVERILGRAVAYVLASGVLALTFAVVAGTAGRLAGRGESHLPSILATLAAVAVAAPAYRAFQEQVDRRFNRRRFDTLRVIREHVRAPAPGTDVEAVLRDALADPTLRATYWVEARRQWVTGAGGPAEPTAADLVVRRHDRLVARIRYDETAVGRELAEAAVAEAAPELVNAGLRAAIALQLTEVRESRARIAAAQLTERRRIERDLHDGAQQRLLALALHLRAAQVNGDPAVLRSAIATGVGELRAAVTDLRELANGLQPAALGESGLAAALDELAARLPLEVVLDATGQRFGPQLESTAWFIACEAISNAVKHSGATRLEVGVRAEDGQLVVSVADGGTGGADPDGSGLRGIADRAEAAGGTLTVRDRPGGGTVVTGRLPCGS